MYKSKPQPQPQPQPSYSGSSVGSADYGEVGGGGSEVSSYQVESGGPEVIYDDRNPAPVDPYFPLLPINQIDGETLRAEVKEAFKVMELLGKAQEKEDLSFMDVAWKFTLQMHQGDSEED